LRDIFRELRAAGKEVVCYLPEGGGNRELFVALAASRIYMAPYSAFGPLGLAARPLYIRPLLDRLGIAVEAQAAGEYKSAAEPALRDTMSEPQREQLQALLTGTHTALVDALRARGLSDEQLGPLFERVFVWAKDALACGVVDGVVYEDELREALSACAATATAQHAVAPDPAKKSDSDNPPPLGTDAARYLRWRNRRLWRPLRRPTCIAVVPLHGTIVAGQGGMMGASLRPDVISKLVRSLADDPSVRAVVFHIDSPGGSALASELMHRELTRLAKKKPIVACLGEVAASGGYYLACACRKIVAQPLAITGSIGVISAKIDARGLLDRLGVRPQFLRTTPSADILSFARGLSVDEDALLRAHATEIYERFLTVVAEGRGRSVADIEPLARGRVWNARDASERGLVDVLGGLERALSEVRGLLDGVPEPERDAIEPRIYALRSGSGFALSALRSALLGPWSSLFSELATVELLRREPVAYYAPFTTPLE
jgi:protease-4